MMRSLHIARTGLDAQQLQLDIISNNLANVNTTGYKRSQAVFEDLLYQIVRQPGAQSSQQTQIPSGLQLGTGVRAVATQKLFTQGGVDQTDNPLDISIEGRGFFQILLPDGTTAYTRAGNFQIDGQGVLVTANGYQLQPAITVPTDLQSLTVGRDGVVTATLVSGATQQLGQIQLANFVNPSGLLSTGENLFIETVASGAPQINNPGVNGVGNLNHKYKETSNVNVGEELVNMVIAQRAFELNSRAITTSDQMLQRLTQL